MRKRTVFLVVSCAVVATVGYLAFIKSGGAKGSREEELAYLRAVLPDNLLELAHLDISSRESVVVGGEGPDRHLGLRVFPGQKRVHGGVRAEVSVDYPFRPGDCVRYTWRFRIPDGFTTDAPANRWWVISQWHDQPDPLRGETWDKFMSRSPPVLLGLGELDGQLALSLGYGLTTEGQRQQELGPLRIERGRWHHLAVVIHWSRGPGGSAEVFLDNAPKATLTARGPNMNNSYQHFWKLGQYRHPDIGTDNWIHLADLRAEATSPSRSNSKPGAATDGGVR